jgi:ribosome-associated protein
MEDVLVTPAGLRISPSAFQWKFSRSGGAGGQHVNKTESRVELRLIVAESGLPQRVMDLLGDEVRLTEQSSRSQHRNREIATERLLDLIDDAAKPKVARRKTKPRRGAIESRLDDKRRTAAKKADRRAPLD